MRPLTTIHVTHEACEQIGGIGAVLEGLVTSPVYQQAVRRTILVGPMYDHLERPGTDRLGPFGNVLYSTLDSIDRASLGYRFRPIEWAFNVAIVYGRRTFRTPGGGRTGEAEVLLLDVTKVARTRLERFKHRLWESFGLESDRYEHDWAYEEYVRLAEPAFHAALAIIRPEELPAVLLAHEFMGLPAAFKAILDGQESVRTVFHAHECATARRLVEEHPGHDLSFYNVLRAARRQGLYVGDVYGDQSHHFRHALISRAHLCDAIFAVGTLVAEEMHFLDRRFDHHRIDRVHNGAPAWTVTPDVRFSSRQTIQTWAERVTGRGPDLIFSHVTRPVVSKGIWRDFQVCHRLEAPLAAEGRTALLIVLTSAAGSRRPQDVRSMAEEYGWPHRHRDGYPDLVGPEADIAAMVAAFNREHSAVQAILVNQFGFSGDLVGCPDLAMDFATLRAAADAEFGLATYEPFGISPLEPLASGAVCVISDVCGCRWFVEEAAGGAPLEHVIVGAYSALDGPPIVPLGHSAESAGAWKGDGQGPGSELPPLHELLAIDGARRHAVEERVAEALAERLMAVLPRTDADRLRLLAQGQAIVPRLGWDAILRGHFLPTLERIVERACL